MKTRAFLILAILAGLGSAGVACYQWSCEIPSLIQQRDAEKIARDNAVIAHNLTKADLKNSTAALNQARQALAAARSERASALARFDAQEKRATSLADKFAKTSANLEVYQTLAAEYKATGLNPEEVAKLRSNLIAAQKQMVVAAAERDQTRSELVAVSDRLAKFGAPAPCVWLPSNLKGSVSVVDPKWDFVVVNVGENQGAVVEGEMLVSRGGKLVAKVMIRSVEKDRCIADVVPNWKFGDILEGDTVIPAGLASSYAHLEPGSARYMY